MAEPPGGFLACLDGAAQAAVVAAGRVRRYPARSILFFAGDGAHDVLIVRRGDIKVSVTVDGHEVVLDVLGEGDILGELSAIDGGVRSATAVAINECEVIAISMASFAKLLTDVPAIGLTLMRSISGRLRDASRRQVEYGALDAVGRTCRRLVEMMQRYGQPDGDGAVVIANPLSQQDIAAWAGLSREATVKALHALRTLGWVTTSPGTIRVIDVGAVTARASMPAGEPE
jgi:CRP/FNR family cyclic AMP-dependent transcriptional regulator